MNESMKPEPGRRPRRTEAEQPGCAVSPALRVTLAVLAVVTYNSWLLWPLNGDSAVLRGYLSELAAQDQPYQWFFRLADVASACVFTVIALLGRRAWSAWLGRWAKYLALALFLVAVGTFFDAVFNLPCAESRDAVCASTFTLTRRLHEAASVVASGALIAIVGLVAWAMAEADGWRRPAISVAVLTGVIAVLLIGSAVLPFFTPGVQGPSQMVQVPLSSAWIAYLAWRMDGRPGRGTTRPEAARPDGGAE